MLKTIYKCIMTAAALLIVASSCSNRAAKDPSRYLPSITGDAGDVLVVTNRGLWNGELGNVIRELLASDYPFLPQREATFNVYNTSPKDFSGSFLLHRNILIVNVSSEIDSCGITFGSNSWAKPQIVITVSAEDQNQADSIIKANSELIVNSIEQAERDRLISNATKYEDVSVRQTVTSNIGGSPYFPRGFTIKKSTPEFTWISQETTHVNQGILIFKYPYTDISQLDPANLKQKLYDLWQANVPGMRDNSYMTFNKLIEPGFNTITYKGRRIVEVRGLWEVENDFMGGPFVCHVFPDKENENIIILNAFVYAPKYDKRKYLRQVESILYSFEWEND